MGVGRRLWGRAITQTSAYNTTGRNALPVKFFFLIAIPPRAYLTKPVANAFSWYINGSLNGAGI